MLQEIKNKEGKSEKRGTDSLPPACSCGSVVGNTSGRRVEVLIQCLVLYPVSVDCGAERWTEVQSALTKTTKRLV